MAEIVSCTQCYQEFEHKNGILKYRDAGYVCTECAKKLHVCGVCKGRRKNVVEMHDGTVCCHLCLKDNPKPYVKCSNCEKYHHHRVQSTEIDKYEPHIKSSNWCPTCVEAVKSEHKPNKRGKCPCGRTTYRMEEVDGNSIHVCRRCDGNLYKCKECGNYHSRAKEHLRVSKKECICPSCYLEKGYIRCKKCMFVHKPEEMSSLGQGICNNCAKLMSSCPKCKALRSKREMVTVYDGEVASNVCRQCASKYKTCDMCDRRKRIVVETMMGDHACIDCRHERALPTIHSWRYRPDPFIMYGKGSRLYLGIENEFSVGDTGNVQTVLRHIAKSFHDDVLYVQHDGTVYNGAEIVTHPMTYKTIKDDEFSLKDMFHPDMVLHPSTGMHIHMSRDAFSTMHLYKFMNFLSNNPKFTEYIAERKGGQARQWLLTHPDALMEKARGGKVDPHKYVDVNLQHPKSVELRIFAGVVTYEAMMKNIQFVVALHRFTGKATKNSSAMTEDFVAYVDKNKKEFNHLYDFIAKAPAKVVENPCPEEAKKRRKSPLRPIQEGDRVRVRRDLTERLYYGAITAFPVHSAIGTVVSIGDATPRQGRDPQGSSRVAVVFPGRGREYFFLSSELQLEN